MHNPFFWPEKKMFSPTPDTMGTNPNCIKCGLYKGCNSPKMKVGGQGKRKILVIAEAPGQTEDKLNDQLVGKVGVYTECVFKEFGIDLHKDCWKINAVNCRPPDNRSPQSKEICACRPKVWRAIDELEPYLIILMGGHAIESFLQHRWKRDLGGITRWRGWQIPDRNVHAWVCPVYHPSYVLRNEIYFNKSTYNVAELIFKRDLKRAFALLNKKFPKVVDEKELVHPKKEKDAIFFLTSLIKNKPEIIAVDFETTGLKPHRKGHRIVSCSISTTENNATSFLVTDKIKPYLATVLEEKTIGKILHNLRFEQLWSMVYLKARIRGIKWDSMEASHILDNRKHITGLKFQTYVHFGVIDYSSSIEPYLESDDGGNGFNNIDKVDKTLLLLYNGLDTIFTYKLAMLQMELWKNKPDDALRLETLGASALCDIQNNGIAIDIPYYKDKMIEIDNESTGLLEKINKTKELKEWKRIYGDKFKMGSGTQLADVLFNKLDYQAVVFTEKTHKPSTKIEHLKKLKIPMIKMLLRLGKLKKIKDKILEVLREEVDGKIHPSFGLHLARTYRGQCDHPNFQNLFKRDKEAAEIIRKGIIARKKTNYIIEIDCKANEVKASTCYHKDPIMINYLVGKGDMHGDEAMECYMLNKKQLTNEIRYCGKNKFVFPEFYGDYYINCAKALWGSIKSMDLVTKDTSTPLKEHLASKGILRYYDFEQHIQKVEHKFWFEKFNVYREWKDGLWESYLKSGHVDMLTGFRCQELLRRNEAINRPIQGTAFHWLLWSLIQLNKWLKKNHMMTKIIAQIHDSMMLDSPKEEVDAVLEKTKEIMCVDIKKHWKWIIVPLETECEISKLGGNWFELEKRKVT